MRHLHNTLCLALIGLSGLTALALLRPSDVRATPVAASKQLATPSPMPDAEALDAGVVVDAALPEPAKTTATIVFATTPPVAANVTWGRKLLGRIKPGEPLVVVRPRDSGPLDVMVRATGYLPVQTRAHTFSDTRVQVKLTPPENISELLGYRLPLDGGLEGGLLEAGLPEGGSLAADAGVAVEASPLAPTPAAPVPFQAVPAAPAQSPWLMP